MLAPPVAAVVLSVVATTSPTAVAMDQRAAEDIARDTLFRPAPESSDDNASSLARKPFNWLSFGGARALAAVGRVVGLEAASRPLTTQEIAFLRPIFGASVDLSQVGVTEGRAMVRVPRNSAATVGNSIYFGRDAPQSARLELLAHEMTHVWQYQQGGTDYVTATNSDGYDIASAIRTGKPWSKLNREQQATLVQMVARAKQLGISVPGAVLTQYGNMGKTPAQIQAYVDVALAQLRAGVGAP